MIKCTHVLGAHAGRNGSGVFVEVNDVGLDDDDSDSCVKFTEAMHSLQFSFTCL